MKVTSKDMPADPITTTALTSAGAWLWGNYGKSVTDKAASAAKTQWDKFKWNDAAEKYRAKIKKLYGTMQIMGMAEPVPLDDIFADVYMLDKPTAFSRFDIELLKQLSADPDAPPPQARRVNGLRLVREKGNLFILGKPGAGKTTFLKYIALQSAEQNIDKIPIFISLKQWADSGAELMAFITERFDICDFPAAQPFVEELLRSGNAIALFDGLDEVNQESGQRDEQRRQMNNFVDKYDRAQCLITCRIAANDYSFEPFFHVEIADFTEKQIQRFVSDWFRRDEKTRDKFLSEFTREDNKGLRDLARTPLLLTLLCMTFDETLTIPPRRVEIYEEALNALLKKWDSTRRIKRDEIYRKLSLGHKENMLARIAAETFERNEYFIPQKDLERLITDFVKNVPPHDTNGAADGEVILKAIEAQHGIFVERAHAIYSFSHLTFQEYFTAKYIVTNATKGTLAHLVKAYCIDGRWREVFLLTTSLLPDARELMLIFRRGVAEVLEGDEKLKSLLTKANNKAGSTQAASWLVRLNYLFVELYYPSRARALVLARDLDRDLARDRDRDLTCDLNLDLDRALARSLARARARIRDLDRVRSFDRDCSFDRDLVRDRDLDRARALALGLHEFAKELEALWTPVKEANAADWQEYADRLRALMIKHRDIGHEWEFTDTQETRLANYLNATRLLRDCLELAFMPPDEKKAMLNSLYLPPAHAGAGRDA